MLEKYCVMTSRSGQNCWNRHTGQFQFSTRAYHKILKVARTIADMGRSRKDPAGAYRGGSCHIGLMIKNTGHKTAERKVLYNGRNTENRDPLCGKKQQHLSGKASGTFRYAKTDYIILEDFRKIINRQQRSLGARLCSALWKDTGISVREIFERARGTGDQRYGSRNRCGGP